MTKPLPGPTNREYRKLMGVKAMSLGTNSSFYCLECCQYISGSDLQATEKTVWCAAPCNEVIKSDPKGFLLHQGLHEDKLCDTSQAMAPTNVETVHQISLLYREQPRSIRMVVAYPRLAFSPTKRTNHAQSVSINKPKFLKATRHAEIRKNKYQGP